MKRHPQADRNARSASDGAALCESRDDCSRRAIYIYMYVYILALTRPLQRP